MRSVPATRTRSRSGSVARSGWPRGRRSPCCSSAASCSLAEVASRFTVRRSTPAAVCPCLQRMPQPAVRAVATSASADLGDLRAALERVELVGPGRSSRRPRRRRAPSSSVAAVRPAAAAGSGRAAPSASPPRTTTTSRNSVDQLGVGVRPRRAACPVSTPRRNQRGPSTPMNRAGCTAGAAVGGARPAPWCAARCPAGPRPRRPCRPAW